MKQKIISILVTVVTIITVMVPVYATTRTISLPANQVWSGPYADSRSGQYSYVQAGCDSVYPNSGTDTFTKIQVRVRNDSGDILVGTTTLTEGSGLKSLTIREGYLTATRVWFDFRGNSSAAATAVVEYKGK